MVNERINGKKHLTWPSFEAYVTISDPRYLLFIIRSTPLEIYNKILRKMAVEEKNVRNLHTINGDIDDEDRLKQLTNIRQNKGDIISVLQ